MEETRVQGDNHSLTPSHWQLSQVVTVGEIEGKDENPQPNSNHCQLQ